MAGPGTCVYGYPLLIDCEAILGNKEHFASHSKEHVKHHYPVNTSWRGNKVFLYGMRNARTLSLSSWTQRA